MKRFLSIVLAMLMLVVFFSCDALLTSTDGEDLACETKTIGSTAKLSINNPRYKTSLEMLQKVDRKEYGDVIDVERIKNVFEYDFIQMNFGRYYLFEEESYTGIDIFQLRNGESLDYKIYDYYFHKRDFDYSEFEDYKEYTAQVEVNSKAVNIYKYIKEGVVVYLFPEGVCIDDCYIYPYSLMFRIENHVFRVVCSEQYFLLENGMLPTLEDLENQKSEYDSKALTTFYELTNFYTEESELIRMLKQEVWVAGIPIATE